MNESLLPKDDQFALAGKQIESIGSHEHYFEAHLAAFDVSGQHCEEIEFEQSRLARVTARKTRWSHPTFLSVRIDDCDWANARVERGTADDTWFFRCRLTGLELSETHLRGCHFHGCKLDLAAIHETKWRKCHLSRCDLRGADFQACELREVTFRDCDLRNARFLGNRLRSVDVRGSRIDGLQVESESLRHLTIDPTQVMYFASLTGLVIRDLETDD